MPSNGCARYALPVEEVPVYEVRCERCQTSFAPETRRCIHCGGPVGRGRAFAALGGPDAMGRGAETDDGNAMAEFGDRMRGPLWIITVALAVAASIARTCSAG